MITFDTVSRQARNGGVGVYAWNTVRAAEVPWARNKNSWKDGCLGERILGKKIHLFDERVSVNLVSKLGPFCRKEASGRTCLVSRASSGPSRCGVVRAH